MTSTAASFSAQYRKMMGGAIAQHLDYDRDKATKATIKELFFKLQPLIISANFLLPESEWSIAFETTMFRSVRAVIGRKQEPAIEEPPAVPETPSQDAVIERLDDIKQLLVRLCMAIESRNLTAIPVSAPSLAPITTLPISAVTTVDRSEPPSAADTYDDFDEEDRQPPNIDNSNRPAVEPQKHKQTIQRPPKPPLIAPSSFERNMNLPTVREQLHTGPAASVVIDVALMGVGEGDKRLMKREFAGRVNFVFIEPRETAVSVAKKVRGAHVLCHGAYQGLDAMIAAQKHGRSFAQLSRNATDVTYRQNIEMLIQLRTPSNQTAEAGI